MRHKQYDFIVAWAEGKEIQYKWPIEPVWTDCPHEPSWNSCCEFRIKPVPKGDCVRYSKVRPYDGEAEIASERIANDNLKLTFDGETGALKAAEVIS